MLALEPGHTPGKRVQRRGCRWLQREHTPGALTLEAHHTLEALELDLCLEVGASECLALAGPSGAGKSTVLRIAAGLAEPKRGRVICAGEVWLDSERGISMPPDRRRVGFLFQDYALFPNLSAWRNVAYGMDGVARAQRRERAVALLERFGIGARADARVPTLSGGERQRVALARALARRPRALLLDEPLSALDTRTRASASRELGILLREARVPAILITHDFEEAALLSDRVAVIDAGKVVQTGTAAELGAAPESAFVADFTGAVILAGEAHSCADGLTEIALDGGGTVRSTGVAGGGVASGGGTSGGGASGRVAVTVHPWEISVEPAGAAGEGSAQNRLTVTVASVSPVGNRVRVGLLAPQPLVAELTDAAARRLELAPGAVVVAAWKATATRLVVR